MTGATNEKYIDVDGDVFWYKDGQLHREGGPAIEYVNGGKTWWLNGKRHREDGPALEYPDGRREWYRNGMQHREYGPAVEHPDGHREWWFNNQLHREDGPAIEWENGEKHWFIHGLEFTEKEFMKRIGLEFPLEEIKEIENELQDLTVKQLKLVIYVANKIIESKKL